MTRTSETYEMLLELVKTRMSVRKFRSDPIPEDAINKILEVARWAMSGANSQPWEFIVVTDPNTKKQLRDAYSEYNTDFIFWMEQQREYNLRHPSYQVKNDPHESLKFNKAKANWHQDTSCKRFRENIYRAKQAASGWALLSSRRSADIYRRETDYGLRAQEQVAVDVY
ncbi:MAG TPA: nitroreductase family protein [Candidatus Binatia bacterium]|jgi:nitroreductase|nr:nitroreductase family protein [Candidatus Binatia bacterium]